jgi:hypothetical protein
MQQVHNRKLALLKDPVVQGLGNVRCVVPDAGGFLSVLPVKEEACMATADKCGDGGDSDEDDGYGDGDGDGYGQCKFDGEIFFFFCLGSLAL